MDDLIYANCRHDYMQSSANGPEKTVGLTSLYTGQRRDNESQAMESHHPIPT